MVESQNRSHQVLAVNIVFFVTTWVSTSLRVYVRYVFRIHVHDAANVVDRSIMIKSFGADDWAMCSVVLLFTAYLSCQLGGLLHGTGQHRSAITDENAQIALMVRCSENQ